MKYINNDDKNSNNDNNGNNNNSYSDITMIVTMTMTIMTSTMSVLLTTTVSCGRATYGGGDVDDHLFNLFAHYHFSLVNSNAHCCS